MVAARRVESTRNLLALSGASSRIIFKTVPAGSGNRSTLNTKDSAGSGGGGGGGEAGSQREAAEAEANADLPDGWVAAWSKSRQIFYWRRAADNATSWEKPTQP